MSRFARYLIAAVAVLASAVSAFGQSSAIQGGPGTPGHVPMYFGPPGSSQVIIGDSGSAAGGGVGTGIGELGVIARGTGTPPYAGQGTGQLGTNICDYDAPITNATGYHFLCFSANAQGGGLIAYGAAGGASSLSLLLNVNGALITLGTGTVQISTTYTVATLPTCNSSAKGTLAIVTDANAPTYNATVAGSGAVVIPVFCNGANWTAH